MYIKFSYYTNLLILIYHLYRIFRCAQRKMDIHLICDKHLIYSVVISIYLAAISEIFILTYLNISDSKAEY